MYSVQINNNKMECDLDDVYEKIKKIHHHRIGAKPGSFKYVGGILKQIPHFQSCEQFLKHLHPRLNELFVLHSFMTFDDNDEYVLFERS